MTTRGIWRPVLYGSSGGLALGLLLLISDRISLVPAICICQFIVMMGCGAGIGLVAVSLYRSEHFHVMAWHWFVGNQTAACSETTTSDAAVPPRDVWLAVDIHRSYRRAAIAELLAIVAIFLALGGFWYQARVYESHAGQDLDMPEWFVINFDLAVRLLPVVLLGGLLDLVSLILFSRGCVRRGWVTWATFVLLWAVSMFLVSQLAYSLTPASFR